MGTCSPETKKYLKEAARREMNRLLQLQADGLDADLDNGITSIEDEIANMQSIQAEKINHIKDSNKDLTKEFTSRFGKTVKIGRNGSYNTVNTLTIGKVEEVGSNIRIVSTDNKVYTFVKGQDVSKSTQKGQNIWIRDLGKYSDATVMFSESAEQTQAEGEVILEKAAIYNINKVKETAEKLIELDNVSISEEHRIHLMQVLEKLVDPVLKALPEFQIHLNTKAVQNYGMFTVKNGESGIFLGRGEKAQTYGNEMSVLEKFVHELVHGGSHFAINYNRSEVANTLNRLKKLHTQAMKELTVEDLMPKVTINYEAEYAVAKERLEYINGNIEEFLAYALTHEGVINKLKNLEVYTKEDKPKGFIGSLIYYVNKLIDFALMKWRQEPNTINGNQLVMKLMHEFMQANNTGQREAKKTTLDKIDEFIDMLESKGIALQENAKSKILKKAIERMPYGGTKLDYVKWLAANTHEILLNKEHAGLLEGILTSIGLKPEGILQTQMRMWKDKDNHQLAIEDIMMWSGQVERQRESMAGQVGAMINTAFSRTLKKHEKSAIYKMMLKDDAIILVDQYSQKDLAELYKDPSKLQTEINKQMQDIKAKAGKSAPLVEYRINDLVKYMQTGKGSLITLRNAEAIARNLNSAFATKTADPDLVNMIDKVVSLKNIQENTEENRTVMADLIENEHDGIVVTSNLQKGIISQLQDRLEPNEKLNYKKGHLREVYDDAYTSTVAPLSQKKEMLEKGYTEVIELPRIGRFGEKETTMAMYVSRDMIRQKLNRSTLRYTGDKQQGRSIFDNLLKTGEALAAQESKDMIDTLKMDASSAIHDIMQGKTPKVNEVVTPEFNARGSVVEYRYNVEMEHKLNYLGLETDGVEAIARTWAHEVDIEKSHEVNTLAFQEMVANMAIDFRGSKIGKSGKEYILLDINSKHPLAREYAKILPKEIKALIKELKSAELDEFDFVSDEVAKRFVGDVNWEELSVIDREALKKELGKGNIWLRRDMLHDIMGVRDISITNLPLIKELPRALKTYLLKFENFWKQIVQIFKVDIVIKLPAVIIGNIVSNFMYSIQMGQSPIATAKTSIEGLKELNMYLEDEKRLIEVKAKLVTNPSNKGLQSEYARLNNHMQNSAIRPLIDAGLYSHIIEDVNLESFKSSNKIANWMNEKTENAPELIKDGVNWLFLTERTSYFQMIQSATAKSDFVARYSQYVYNMQLANKKFERDNKRKPTSQEAKDLEHKVLRDIRDAFINYNKPDDPLMQYMNDMGFVMFTKWALRIQKVWKDGVMRHPIRFALAIIGQEGLDSSLGWDPSDISEKSAFINGFSNLLYSPEASDYLERLLVPASIRAINDGIKGF